MIPVVAVAVAGALGLSACSSGTGSPTTTVPTTTSSSDPYAQADLHAPAGSLTGAGSTFDQPFFTKAFYVYNQQNSGVTVNYASIGSGGGIQQFQANTVNFGASDVPMSPAGHRQGDRRPGPAGAGGPGRRHDLLQRSRSGVRAQAHARACCPGSSWGQSRRGTTPRSRASTRG